MYNIEYKAPSDLAGVKTWIDMKTLNDLSIFPDEIQQSGNDAPESINAIVEEVFETQSINFNNAKQNELKSWADNVYKTVPYKKQ